jgi:RHS repeat-associated protein
MSLPRHPIAIAAVKSLALRLPLLALATLLSSLVAQAQITNVTADQGTPVPGVGHDYLKMLNETVNPATGTVSIRISVPVPQSRGITIPFTFGYDSNAEHHRNGANFWDNSSYLGKGGWSYIVPNLSFQEKTLTYTPQGGHIPYTCHFLNDHVFQDPSGTTHNLALAIFQPSGNQNCQWPSSQPSNVLAGGAAWVAGGDPWVQAVTVSGFFPPLTVSDASGTVYYFSDASTRDHQVLGAWSALPDWIEDRNGNKITITDSGNGAFVIPDTTGRNAITSSGFGATGNTVAISGLPQPYTITWGTSNVDWTYNVKIGDDLEGTSTTCGTTGLNTLTLNNWPLPEVTEITLPNGQSYQFQFSDTTSGLITKLIYPGGGYVRYVWGTNPLSDSMDFYPDSNGNFNCHQLYDTQAITDRYVSFDGSTEPLHQHFAYFTNWVPGTASPAYQYWTYKTTTVTTYVQGNSFTTVYQYFPYDIPPNPYDSAFNVKNFVLQWAPVIVQHPIPVENTVTYNSTSGSTLLTTTKAWQNQYQLNCELRTLDSGQISGEFYAYGSGGIITDKKEYDYAQITSTSACQNGAGFPSATPVRETVTTPETFADTPMFPNGPSIFDRPASVVINGNGTQTAETDYAYDIPVGTTTSGIVQHFTGCNCGNVTKQSQWANSSGATLNTTFTNDDTGQRLTMTDPRGNQTTYSYTDSYSSGAPSGPTNAYLTTLTLPSTANAAHIEKFSYAYASGEVTSSTDQNNLVTSYKYVDNLARLTETDSPDGGVTSISYNDSPYNPSSPSPSVTTTKKINSTSSFVIVKALDGIGHAVRTELTSDPQGIIYTDTAYDGLGRVYTVSNPYRSGTDPTTSSGTTTYIYDVLGRKCVEVPPDGTAVTGNACPAAAPAKDLFTQYSGNTTTVTDQTGKKRQSTTDSLGRLTQVVEDPGGLGYITYYTNDALGNLTQVVQNGSHTRTFTYDFLSRLLTSNNPEVGTITYKYDSDTNCSGSTSFLGLLVSKTDSRGIRACAQYDQLNRETVHNYSNGDATITTAYDQPACLVLTACQNIGHATSVTDGAGSEAWAYQTDPSNLRSAHANQRTTTSSPSNITKNSTYYFDLANNLTSITYPTGRIVNYTYDAANRPATAADSANGITYAAAQSTPPSGCLSSGVCYTPQGSEYSVAIGKSSSFTGVNIAETYNTRLQPLEIKASSSAGSASDITYSFVDPTSGGNAGHVNTITNNINSSRSQSIAYDHLDRIVSAGTTATTGTYCWGYQYTYDAWANLTSQAGWSPNYNGCSEATMGFVTAYSNNQISGFTYDASGNTQSDGTIAYTYDAESQIKTAAGVTYLYDGSGRRVSKSNGKLYWYGSGGEILAETDASGNTLNEYVFFGGKRVALISATGGTALPVQNASFEIANAWTNSCGTNCNYNGGPVPDWTFSGTGEGSFEPNSSYFNLPLPDGNVVAYLNAGSSTQTLTDVNFLPNTTYTLSAYVGHRLDGYVTSYTVALQAGSTVLNSVSGSSSTITTGNFAQVTVTYTTGSTPPSGYVTIVLTSAGSQSNFDKVTLTASGGTYYYVEDMLGTSRVMTQANGTVCYDADFDPYGGEHPYTDNCPQNYKFEGKERDIETGNDEFGARYYSSRFGRWLSADWSSTSVAVPYANLTNPQTLNLYSMVADDPESFADLDGHCDWCSRALKSLEIGAAKGIHNFIQKTFGQIPAIGEYGGTMNMVGGQLPLEKPSNVLEGVGMGGSETALTLMLTGPAAGPAGGLAEGEAIGPQASISDDAVVVRGGVGEIPSGTFSGSVGSTEESAGLGIKNNQMQTSTAGAIREAGGTVEYAPEPAYPGGPTNYRHVNVTGGQKTFSAPKPNTAPKNLRPPSPPKPPKPPNTTNDQK